MNNKYWYVEISGTLDGMVHIEKFYAGSLLTSYVDNSGMLHKRIRVSSDFSLDSMDCKNMLFDYMEENGGLDMYNSSDIKGSYEGVDWLGKRNREYNLLFGKRGKLAIIYTDSKNINTLLHIRKNNGRLLNNKKELPTNKFEYTLKSYLRAFISTLSKLNTKVSLNSISNIK